MKLIQPYGNHPFFPHAQNPIPKGTHDSKVKQKFNGQEPAAQNFYTLFAVCGTNYSYWGIEGIFNPVLYRLGRQKMAYYRFVLRNWVKLQSSNDVRSIHCPPNVLVKFLYLVFMVAGRISNFHTFPQTIKHLENNSYFGCHLQWRTDLLHRSVVECLVFPLRNKIVVCKNKSIIIVTRSLTIEYPSLL